MLKNSCYLAGPMRGIAKFNHPIFFDMAAKLGRLFTVYNPAEHDRSLYPFMYDWPGYATGDESKCPELSENAVFTWDLERIVKDAEFVALLPGYENSRGATRERLVAHWCGKPCYLAADIIANNGLNGLVPVPPPEEANAMPPSQKAQTGVLPEDSKTRKEYPIVTGLLDYFPDACAEVAHISYIGNIKHNGPDAPLHWSRDKSSDHEDCIGRHTLQRGTRDANGCRHTANRAWRALAALQLEIESDRSKASRPIEAA